jgi:hypothetical protein
MIVDEDAVEAMFLAELCSFDGVGVGFVGCLEDSASESDPTFHASVLELIVRAIYYDLVDLSPVLRQAIRLHAHMDPVQGSQEASMTTSTGTHSLKVRLVLF